MATDFVFQETERVRKQMAEFQGKPWNVLLDFIKKGEVEKVGERDYRIPFQNSTVGRFGTVDLNMGDMGRGSSFTGGVMVSSYFPLRCNFEIPKLATLATQDKERALVNAFRKTMQDGLPQFIDYIDSAVHSDGTPLLAQATNHAVVSGCSVYTLDSNVKYNLLRRGQYVTVYDTTWATLKTASTFYVKYINWAAKTVTLSGTVPSAATTDKIAFEGVSGASPTSIKGLYYWINTSTSTYRLGVNPATEPDVVANGVSASGGLVPEHFMFIIDRITERNRNTDPGNLIGLMNPATRTTIVKQAMQVQIIDRAKTDNVPDMAPNYRGKKFFAYGGVNNYLDIKQNASRIDIFDPKDFGRAQLTPGPEFFELDGSNQRFFSISGGSGAPLAGTWFGLISAEDIYHTLPSNTGVISSIPIETIYQ